ncbi:hypothetical protein Tco_0661168 [Tanacetum coccineum]
MTSQQKNKFFKDVKHYFWDDPFLFKICAEQSDRLVFPGKKLLDILKLATVTLLGHYGPITDSRKIDSDSIGPPSTRMPMTLLPICDIGPFPSSRGNKYILVLLTILSKWVKQKRSPPIMPELYSRIVKALDSVIFNSSFTSSASFWEFRTDNQEKDKKQNDKTGLGMEKTVKEKSQIKRPEINPSKSQQKNNCQSQSQPKSTPLSKSKK